MRLDVANVRSVSGKQLKGEILLDINSINVNQEKTKILEPVAVDYTAINKGKFIELTGIIQAKLQLYCGRCLQKVDYLLCADYDEKFIHQSQVDSIEPDILEEGHVFVENEIPLTHMVEQNIIFNMPLRVLCDDDCRGLCEHCGVDLNKKTCHCDKEHIDPRLSVLKELLKTCNSPKEVEK